MVKRHKDQDFKKHATDFHLRLTASATRGIKKMFAAALKYNPRIVYDPNPTVRMSEQELEVLFDRLHQMK